MDGLIERCAGLDIHQATIVATVPPAGQIKAKIPLIAHEQNPLAVMNVTVIVDIDQKMLRHDLLLNPRMKHRNE